MLCHFFPKGTRPSHEFFCGFRVPNRSVAQPSRYDQRPQLIEREIRPPEHMTVLDRERNQEAFADAEKSGSAI
jgi:hypothetical protein